ncbi:ATP-binding cassette domain-containing protein [Aquabacter cavernae]|uniref:ATP-binding cassette domain-containing protein n=1 Tax=Aquabacter cavernae TaxID=2496029 RepID=UPI000F8F6807|nr:ABC transporter ATP-binding protein [Aquabacter cavernae]
MQGLLRRCAAFGADVARHAGGAGVVAALLVGLGAMLDGIGIALLVPVLATLFGAADPGGPLAALVGFLPPGLTPAHRLAVLLGVFAVLMVIRVAVLWLRDVRLSALQVGYVEALRAGLAQRLAAAPWEALARIGHARVNSLLGGDVQRCGAGVHFLLQAGTACVMIIVQVGVAVLLSPVLAVGAFVLMGGGALLLGGLMRHAHRAGRGVTLANHAVLDEVGRFLSGMKIARSQNLEARFVAAFSRSLEAARRDQTAFIRQQSLMRGLWSLMGALVAVAVVWAGFAWLALPAPVLLTLLVVLSRVAGPASQLQLGLQQIAYSLPAWEEVRALSTELERDTQPPPPAAEPPPEGAVRLEGVTYRHAGGGGVRGASLVLAPGEVVGLTGPSGAGKTTLLDLLSGLVRPQEGQVRVGGVVLDAARAARWREQLAYVAQDPVMFNDTVRANLAWMRPDADAEAMAQALRRAGALALVERLPHRLDTVVGERGVLLSGGERQRLALARALLRAPRLLLLDEATNAIDPEGEREIMAALRALDPRPAILVVAHRAETLALCDRVVTLEQGTLRAPAPLRAAAP